MNLPKEIKGNNRIRDAEICQAWDEWHDSELPKTETVPDLLNRLSEKYNITQRRVRQIIMTNPAFILNKEREEFKQIYRVKQHIAKTQDTSKKDAYDWETLLDNKITPRRVEHSGKIDGMSTKIVLIRYGEQPLSMEKETNRIGNQTTEVAG